MTKNDERPPESGGIASTEGAGLAARFQALLSVAESMTSCRDPDELFRKLSAELQRIVSFDRIGVTLYDPQRRVLHTQVLDPPSMDIILRLDVAAEDTPMGWVIESQEPLIIGDVATETRWLDTITRCREEGVGSFCVLPLTTARRRVGVLGFGRYDPVTYTAADVAFLGDVAKLVAVSIENALNFDDAQAAQRQLAAERDHLQLLLDVTNALVSSLDLSGLLPVVSSLLERVIPHEFTALALREPAGEDLVVQAAAFKSGRPAEVMEGRRLPIASSPSGRAFTTRRTQVFGEEELAAWSAEATRVLGEMGIHAMCCVPLVVGDDALGTLTVGSVEPGAFTATAVALIEEVARQVAIAVANAMAYRQIAELKDKLAEERLYLESEIRTERAFEEIIGESTALRHSLQQVEVVAPTDSTVLVLGETGTGKELVARAIHDRSGRRARTFVKINCAAIPSGLLESELFGHERGAFTGAIAQKIGRFEVANGGTLFLDEVGEIPLELQPKLLRVLQEQEFERIGGTKTIKVDVRLIAATNRDLRAMVEEQRFRDDLYYRLDVFPIHVPALRERAEDIPALVRYFVHRLARPMNRHVEVIPTETLDALRSYPWPGNVRELANLIERAMILSPGRTLEVPLDELARRRPAGVTDERGLAAFQGVDRARILRTLKETNWMLGGPRGAAARLSMKRTTLQSIIKRLGIEKPA
ncbi:MAG: GAF domain-containing protein [Deltaproteobacteria bacterium]|nr:MAG: GAF domain-containing protein [Deltaproteobacteria bacterium]